MLTETYNVPPDYEYDLSNYNEEILTKWLTKETFERIRSEVKEAISSPGLPPKQRIDKEYWMDAEKVYEIIRPIRRLVRIKNSSSLIITPTKQTHPITSWHN